MRKNTKVATICSSGLTVAVRDLAGRAQGRDVGGERPYHGEAQRRGAEQHGGLRQPERRRQISRRAVGEAVRRQLEPDQLPQQQRAKSQRQINARKILHDRLLGYMVRAVRRRNGFDALCL